MLDIRTNYRGQTLFLAKSHCHASYLREKDKAHFPKDLQ